MALSPDPPIDVYLGARGIRSRLIVRTKAKVTVRPATNRTTCYALHGWEKRLCPTASPLASGVGGRGGLRHRFQDGIQRSTPDRALPSTAKGSRNMVPDNLYGVARTGGGTQNIAPPPTFTPQHNKKNLFENRRMIEKHLYSISTLSFFYLRMRWRWYNGFKSAIFW